MLGPELEYPILVASCVVTGAVVHILKKVVEAKPGRGTASSIWRYVADYPAQTLTMLLTTAGLVAGLWSIDQLNGLTGFFVGYIGNSAADVIGARVVGQVRIEKERKE